MGRESRIHLPWVRILGLVLVGLAAWVALDPDFHVSRDEVPRLKPPSPKKPSGAPAVIPETPRGLMSADTRFRWRSDVRCSEWRVVLLSGDRRELAWGLPQRAKSYRPEGRFRAALEPGGTYYWRVVGTKDRSQVRSDLVPIQVR